MSTAVPALFARSRQALKLSQLDLARRLGASRRTGQRWDAGQSHPSSSQLVELAKAVFASDPVLAEEVAVAAGTTVDALGLRVRPLPSPPPPPPPALPPIEGIVDSVVCAAAEAIDILPRVVRPALLAAFARARELQLTIEGVEKALRARSAPNKRDGRKGSGR